MRCRPASAANGTKTPLFTRFSRWTSCNAGKPATFLTAVLVIIVWAVTGPMFHFSDTWQLVINTGTTIVTFLMVFLIQNTQNRDAAAFHVKLDELIRAKKGARNSLLDLEDLSDEELEQLRASFNRIAKQAKRERANGHAETEVAEPRRK